MIRVVCWKWDNGAIHAKKGLRFGAEHVNRLRNMVARNLRMEHEFVCITDDSKGIAKDIRIIPLWDDLRSLGGCYVRLKAFSEEMKDVIGPRFVWLDLDTVVMRDITSLFDREDDFMAWGDTTPSTPYNGSMMMMTAGARRQVWDTWNEESVARSKKMGFVGTDQAWISACLGPGEKRWSTADGVYSFRCHIKQKQLLQPPNNARIIFFHGSADPSQELIQDRHPWVRKHWR